MSNRLQRTRSFVVATIIALVALSLSAAKSEASCGDYLAHGFPSDSGSGSQVFNTDHATMPGSEGVASKRQPPCPCRGASCKSAPANVPIPTSGLIVAPEDECLWVLRPNKPALTQVSVLSRFAELFIPPMIAFRLDRPPNL